MYISTRQFSRHVRVQTRVAIAASALTIVAGILLTLLLDHQSLGHWLMGFGVGYIVCRMLHAIVEQRFVSRELRESREELAKARAESVTIE